MPSKSAVIALCLTFALSKYWLLTNRDAEDPVPNVGRCRKRCFTLPVPEV